MNLPNSLTLARIVLVPLLVVVLLTSFQGHLVLGLPKGMAAALIFGVASLTDWLDGYLARRRKQITVLGQLLDPIADKLLTTAAFVSLVQLDMVQAWIVAVVIGRELAVTGLRGVAHTRGLVMPASGLGKLKMVAQVVAILALMLASDLAGEPGRWLHRLGLGAMWVVLGLALWSAVEYYQTFAAVVSGRTAPASEPADEPDPDDRPIPLTGTARTSAASASAPFPSVVSASAPSPSALSPSVSPSAASVSSVSGALASPRRS
jgi:CDP-diacylglycerol--glycerol-3-phosphate 3-phosphatidyltransferase